MRKASSLRHHLFSISTPGVQPSYMSGPQSHLLVREDGLRHEKRRMASSLVESRRHVKELRGRCDALGHVAHERGNRCGRTRVEFRRRPRTRGYHAEPPWSIPGPGTSTRRKTTAAFTSSCRFDADAWSRVAGCTCSPCATAPTLISVWACRLARSETSGGCVSTTRRQPRSPVSLKEPRRAGRGSAASRAPQASRSPSLVRGGRGPL